MSIIGLTHDENNIQNANVKYRGKISVGYAAGEGPNNTNFPAAAGFFRMLTEKTVQKRVGVKMLPVKEWVLNNPVQKALQDMYKQGEAPRMLEVVSLSYAPEDIWESYMAMYNGDGLACKGHGQGTIAKYVDFDEKGDRVWKTRTCTYNECPYKIDGKCKAHGTLTAYPTVDFTPPNPYRLETNSINTIMNIESSLTQIYNMLKLSHVIKEKTAGHKIKFDGLFGIKFILVHKKQKSGGKDVFVTEINLSKESRAGSSEIIHQALVLEGAQMLLSSTSLTGEMESLQIEARDPSQAMLSMMVEDDFEAGIVSEDDGEFAIETDSEVVVEDADQVASIISSAVSALTED